jgi:hypothetical protein
MSGLYNAAANFACSAKEKSANQAKIHPICTIFDAKVKQGLYDGRPN